MYFATHERQKEAVGPHLQVSYIYRIWTGDGGGGQHGSEWARPLRQQLQQKFVVRCCNHGAKKGRKGNGGQEKSCPIRPSRQAHLYVSPESFRLWPPAHVFLWEEKHKERMKNTKGKKNSVHYVSFEACALMKRCPGKGSVRGAATAWFTPGESSVPSPSCSVDLCCIAIVLVCIARMRLALRYQSLGVVRFLATFHRH